MSLSQESHDISCISVYLDIYIIIHSSCLISYEVAIKMSLCLGFISILETVFKNYNIRKVENLYCFAVPDIHMNSS